MIYFGYTTMTHGIKGELKCYTSFSLKEKVLKKGFPIYIEEVCHVITNVRAHKNYYLIEIDHLQDINLVEKFRNQKIFIRREDLHLENTVLLEELFGFEIWESEEMLGKVIDIMYNNGGVLLKISGKKSFYIPYLEVFIQDIDINAKKIYTCHAKDLII